MAGELWIASGQEPVRNHKRAVAKRREQIGAAEHKVGIGVAQTVRGLLSSAIVAPRSPYGGFVTTRCSLPEAPLPLAGQRTQTTLHHLTVGPQVAKDLRRHMGILDGRPAHPLEAFQRQRMHKAPDSRRRLSARILPPSRATRGRITRATSKHSSGGV